MAERVVDVLEFIEVQHQQGDFALFRLRRTKLRVELLVQCVAVGETRERVIRSEVPYSFLFTFAD